jgi:hypothetical protein
MLGDSVMPYVYVYFLFFIFYFFVLLVDLIPICLLSRQLKDAVVFDKAGLYFNPSRVDPSALAINPGPGNNTSHIILPHGNPYSYMMALSTGYVADCNLISPKVTRTSDNEWRMKRISIILHTQEFERMVACFGMVFDFESIDANYADAALIFTTRREYFRDYRDKRSKHSKYFILF